MESDPKYWLIYAFLDMHELGRQVKPFHDLDTMDRWIKKNRDNIIVISRAREVEGK